MKAKEIVAIAEACERQLRENNIPKARMNPGHTLRDVRTNELLAHIHYSCGVLKGCAHDPKRLGTAKSHLAAIRTWYQLAGWTMPDAV